MSPRTGRFQRADRLLKSRDFQRVDREGRRWRMSHFVVLAAQRAGSDTAIGRPRLGLTVSRRVGNAVERNRVKRRVREWFRRSRGALAAGWDLVVIAKPGAAELELREISENFDRALSGARNGRRS